MPASTRSASRGGASRARRWRRSSAPTASSSATATRWRRPSRPSAASCRGSPRPSTSLASARRRSAASRAEPAGGVRMKPVRCGVWGVGVWGEKHARVYGAIPEAELVGVYDHARERAESAAERFGGRVFASPEALLAECEAVSVATPTVAHLEAAQQALAAGCHVLVEKPMAVTVAEADAMIAAAERAGRVLQVGQVERFDAALLAARPFIRGPKFIEAHRMAAFQPRSLDIDVVGDLMIHDIDAVLHLTGQS